ncbi:MAG: hypothetical protein KDC46_15175 [Thermoleophilia bacterium]|nr:hypothetical protein [Thermoleophilia bacterium]
MDDDHYAWLAHLQLLDSALPVGAFAHSWGLEAAVALGDVHDLGSLREYLHDQLHGRWAASDARVVVLPWLLDDPRGSWGMDDVWRLATIAHLSVPASRSREAATAIGRRLLRLLPELHAELDIAPLRHAIAAGAAPSTHQLVHGWAAREIGIPRERAAIGWLHASVTGAVNAAVRLMALGQTDAQRLVADLARDLPAAWARTDDPDDPEPVSFSLLADEHAMLQPRLGARLFMS